MYAIVDIETTGGHASANGITEIAIAIHDGEQILHFYETLINPQTPIPYFIQRLTGINDNMVANAPAFGEVPERLSDAVAWLRARGLGVDWRAAIDSLRPVSQALWHGWPEDTRRWC